MGSVEGKVEVKQALALRATSNVKGDIYSQTLTVEPNAVFNGSCTMGKQDKK